MHAVSSQPANSFPIHPRVATRNDSGQELPTSSSDAAPSESVIDDDGPWIEIPLGGKGAASPSDSPSGVQTPADAKAFFAQRVDDVEQWTTQVLTAARAAGVQDLSVEDFLTDQRMPLRDLDGEVVLKVVRALQVLLSGTQMDHLPVCWATSTAGRTFEPLSLSLQGHAWSAERTRQLCAELVALTGIPLRLLLLSLSAVGDTSLATSELARTLHMELQYGLTKAQSVEVRAGCADALRVLLNGVREGSAHFLGSWAVRSAVSAMGTQPAALGLTALASTAATLGSVYYLYKNATPQYWMQPIASMTALMGLAAVAAVVSAASGGAIMAVGSVVEMPVAQALIVNNLARALRQVVQSYTQSPATAGVTVVHESGEPLNAEQQYRLNILRDLLYVASSVALLGGASVPQVRQALSGLAGITGLSVGLVSSGLNEMVDGWNPDLAKLLYARLGDDLVLVPGTQASFWPDPRTGLGPCLDQIASRTVLLSPADVMTALAMVLRYFGLQEAATSVSFVGAALVGGLGSMRGRALSYMRGAQIVEENGTRNPMGLVSALGHLMRRAVNAVIPGGTAGPAWLAEAQELEAGFASLGDSLGQRV